MNSKISLLFLVISLFVHGCATTTSYHVLDGTPTLVQNRNIAIGAIKGLSPYRSEENFIVLRDQLNDLFGTISYLPANEYLLATENINKESINALQNNLEERKRIFNALKYDYYLKIGIQGFNKHETLVSQSISYRFDIFDQFQPSPISSFAIVVKYTKPGYYSTGTFGGGSFNYIEVDDAKKEKAGFKRAGREIAKAVFKN